jgi:hypothetical protein
MELSEYWPDLPAGALVDASKVAVTDTAGNFTGTNLEEVLDELATAGPGGGSPFDGAIIVASSEAPTAVKDLADYVCDGTADEVQINAAIERASPTQANDAAQGGTDQAVPAGTQAGRVVLTGGEFGLDASILERTGVWLQGQGKLSVIKPRTAFTGVTGYGTPVALIKKYDEFVHLITVSDLTLLRPAAVSFAGSGMYLESGSDLGSYPTSDPDCYDQIRDLYIYGFNVNTTQCGIWIAGRPEGRGVFIDGISARSGGVGGGCGIYIDAVDGAVQNCNLGGTNYPLRVDGGNFRIVNIKAWFAEVAGVYFNSSRITASAVEVQDSFNGVLIGTGSPDLTGDTQIIEGLHVDNCSDTGIKIADSVDNLVLSFLLHQRSGGRYTTMTTGIDFGSGGVRRQVQGVINASNITTPVTGSIDGSGNYARISHGTTVVQYDPLPTATTAQLAAIGDAINTAGKFTGKQVRNTTTGAIVYAAGSTAGSVWRGFDGTTAHTPV